MKIGIIGSMHHSERMLEVSDKLKQMGHEPFVSKFVNEFIGKDNEQKERIKLDQKYNKDAIREFWDMMQDADAVLVLNLNRKGIKHYVGGNTLMEIGFAHVLGQKIFMYNPIPDIEFYKTEIKAVKPVIINGDLSLIK